MNDSLRPTRMTHKYVDDTKLTEFLNKSNKSCTQTSVDELVQQSTDAGMIINARKTMGMLIGGGELCRFL